MVCEEVGQGKEVISKDTTQLFDPDCSTCVHRVERHPSRHSDPSKPRSHNYVCLVCAKAISEHGTWMHTGGFNSRTGMYENEAWVQDVPCRKFDKKKDKWVAIDYEPMESKHVDG